MRKIQEDSLFYEGMRFIVQSVYPRFFRQIEIRGTENIPSGEPVIFAANHQNALMDALGVLFYQPDPIVFMARADIFQSKINRSFLRALKLSPIFRIRDGFENLSKNEAQMKGATEVLLDRKKLCLMPEGNQGDQHKLRPLVKGLFRIAFSAEELLNGAAHVKIIPVGIDYSYYQHAGCDLVISYGKPLEVKDYHALYTENPSNALNVIRTDLAMALSSRMQDIRSSVYYDTIYRLSCYGTPAYIEYQIEKGIDFQASTIAGLRFDARCGLAKVLEKLEAEDSAKIMDLETYCKRLKKLPGSPAEVSEWMEESHSKTYSTILLVLSIVFIPGFLLNYPAWQLSRLICKGVKDKQMHSTIAFTMGMLLNALVYLLVAIGIGMYVHATFFQGVLALIFIGVFGILSERIRQAIRLPLRKLFYSFGTGKKLVEDCKEDFRRLQVELKKVCYSGK